MMDSTTCPFCQLEVSSQDIQRHVEDHLEDDDLSRDFHLAQQMAVAPPPPPPPLVDGAVPCGEAKVDAISSSRSSRNVLQMNMSAGSGLDEKYCLLVSLQRQEKFYPMQGGLISLLSECLKSDPVNFTSYLSGHVDHFESRASEDVGWGCGWRNIQMLSSHLLKQRPEARNVLYGGFGFVPDIGSLQGWLEYAWELGFDPHGSNNFDGKMSGKREWIGTTECATLLRSFGLRAMVVDFCSKEIKVENSSAASTSMSVEVDTSVDKRKTSPFYGPMDRFVSRGADKISHQVSVGHKDCNYFGMPIGNAKGHRVIIDWVWNYFSGNSSTRPGSQPVVLTDKAPLYFQHEGHSRTIIGIQAKRQNKGLQQCNLLVLDPAHSLFSG